MVSSEMVCVLKEGENQQWQEGVMRLNSRSRRRTRGSEKERGRTKEQGIHSQTKRKKGRMRR